CARGFGNFDYW
nr:immunoglobulin heavy chain junction region [Mus musculus]